MKKKNKKFLPVCAVLSAMMIVTAVTPALTVEAAEIVTKKTLNTYLYGMDKQTTTDCLFTDQLPEVPYINPADYLNGIYTVEATEVKNADGTYTVSNKNGSMVIDPLEDKLFFEDFNTLISTDINQDNSEQDNDYSKSAPILRDGEIKTFTVDLSDYGIDVIEEDDSVWIPVPTLNDIAVYTYNTAEYVGGELYYMHSRDVITGKGYFDRSSLYNSLERTPEMADFTYRELCFAVDYFYGKPSKAAIAASIGKIGFDKFLDSFSDKTKTAKELLLSTQKTDYFIGLAMLDDAFDDGGHSSALIDPLISADRYPDSAFSEVWNRIMQDPQNENENAVMTAVSRQSLQRYLKEQPIQNAKEEALADYEPVKEWEVGEGSVKLLVCRDTAVFMFDSFQNEAVRPFKWSLDYAKEHNLKNFVIDLTTNGGGSTSVLNYMMAIITNQKNHTNVHYINELDVPTGNVIREGDILDLNLDGVFDDADKEVDYDFNFAVLTSCLSFSCGNLMPIMCKENGVCLLGETSGGGACISSTFFTPENHFVALSGPIKLVTADGQDADLGAAVDYPLIEKIKYTLPNEEEYETTSYNGFYNFERIDTLVKEFYAKDNYQYGDVNYDGKVNINDATLIQKALADYFSLTDTQKLLADVNGDGVVDIKDVTHLQRYIAEFDVKLG